MIKIFATIQGKDLLYLCSKVEFKNGIWNIVDTTLGNLTIPGYCVTGVFAQVEDITP